MQRLLCSPYSRFRAPRSHNRNTMQLHTLQRKTPNKRSRQVARGGTRGKTAGKGTKGQNARSGRKKRPEMRDIIKRLPKLRGRGVSSLKSILPPVRGVNLSALSEFPAGTIISPTFLFEQGVIRKQNGSLPRVKILGTGEISQKLVFRSCDVSESARKKIEAAGGTIR